MVFLKVTHIYDLKIDWLALSLTALFIAEYIIFDIDTRKRLASAVLRNNYIFKNLYVYYK